MAACIFASKMADRRQPFFTLTSGTGKIIARFGQERAVKGAQKKSGFEGN